MRIAGLNKWIEQNIRMPAGMMTVLIALIVITPMCGFLFNCGCTWPWEGLADDCNYFDQTAAQSCPWCASKWAGGLSVGSSIASGYLISMATWKSSVLPYSKTAEISIRVLLGLVGSMVIAIYAGWMSAELQNYHYFVFANG